MHELDGACDSIGNQYSWRLLTLIICQLQLFLAGVPGQSGLAAATHAVGGTDSDSGAAWMATSARETAPIMRSATLRNALQVSIT